MTNSSTLRTINSTCAAVMLGYLLGFSGTISATGLTLEQQALARSLAETIPWLTGTRVSTRTLTPAATSHPLGRQILSVEKQEDKSNKGTPLIRIYEYNYQQQATRMLVMDLQTQTITREQSISTVHLPLNATEIAFARDLLAADDDLIAQLRAEQIRRGLAPFNSLDELAVKASIHEPMNTEHPCASQRCALLSLFDQSRTVFSTEPVVYLNTLTLETLAPR